MPDMGQIEPMRVFYFLLLLAAVGGWVLAEYRGRMGQALRAALAWGMIFLGVVALYGMWGDIRRDVRPVQEMTASGSLVIPQAADGHYYIRALIDGQEITFMADTGASGVTLTPQDARRLGIDPEGLAYVNQAMTANGVVATATVVLRDVTVGPYHDDRIPAQVNRGEMDVSLLGMDYLGRFQVQLGGGKMVLSR